MKTIISEEKLRDLILTSLNLPRDKNRPIDYVTTGGLHVVLKEVVVGEKPEEDTRPFAHVPENWEHPKNLPEFMIQPVFDLSLSSIKPYRILQKAGISKIWHLVVCYDELLKIKGFGKVYLAEITDILFRLPDYNHVFSLHLRGRAAAWAVTEHLQFEGDLLRLVSILNRNPVRSQAMDKHIFHETQALVF